MTGEQMRHLAGQLAQISQKATQEPHDAAYTLMVAAIMLNRAWGLQDDFTKRMFCNLVDATGEARPEYTQAELKEIALRKSKMN